MLVSQISNLLSGESNIVCANWLWSKDSEEITGKNDFSTVCVSEEV
jgi:hypothetical protein